MQELIKAIEALLADVVPQGHEVKVSAYRVERLTGGSGFTALDDFMAADSVSSVATRVKAIASAAAFVDVGWTWFDSMPRLVTLSRWFSDQHRHPLGQGQRS